MKEIRPPLTLHETLIERHRRKGHDDAAFDALHDAMRVAREGCERIVKKAAIIRGDPMQTPIANERKLRDYVTVEVDRISARMQRARQLALSAIEDEENRMRPSAPKDTGGVVVASDIRAALRSMTPGKRHEAISAADDTVASAIANAPGWLAGLGEEQVAVAVMGWKQRKHPERLERVRALQASVESFDLGDRALASFVYGGKDSQPVVDWSGIEVAEKAERDAKQAASAA